MSTSRSALALAALLLLTACGARWTDAQKAQLAARTHRVSAGQTRVQSQTSDAADNTTAAGANASPEPASTSALGVRSPGGVTRSAGALPCAAHTSEIGVTDSTISVGAISSLTGPVPGLGASSADAARAYVEYRNATGGVCGRRVELKRADDGTDTGRYRAVVNELSHEVLGLAGGFAVGDVGGVDVIRDAQLPVVNVPTSNKLSVLPTLFDIDPDYAPGVVTGKYRYLHDHGAHRAFVAYIAVDQSRYEASEQQRLMKAAGIDIAGVQEIPLSTLSYDSTARAVANSGADYLFFIGDTHANAAMARAMADTGYQQLKFSDYFAYAYNDDFIDAAGPAAEGATVWLRTLPAEETSNPANATFVQWMDRIAPGQVHDDFASQSWIGAKTFFEGLESLPGPITRTAFVNQLRSVAIYDAGGMLAPINLGKKIQQGCTVGIQVQHGRWRRLTPATGFLC